MKPTSAKGLEVDDLMSLRGSLFHPLSVELYWDRRTLQSFDHPVDESLEGRGVVVRLRSTDLNGGQLCTYCVHFGHALGDAE